MSITQLAPHEQAADPPPTTEERSWLAHEFANARHLPKRTCLGCGHSTREGRFEFADCHGWGVEAWRGLSGLDDVDTFRVEVMRLSWAEVARLSAAEGVQTELFAAVST